MLSGGHLTKEVEHWLLWELPLKRANQYFAAALLSMPMQQGLKLVKIDDGVQDEVDRLTAIVIARMKQQKEKAVSYS